MRWNARGGILSGVRGGLFVLLAGFLLTGCATGGGRKALPLKVGVTPDYPPLVYKDAGQVVGVEPDLARRLGQALGRPVTFVELKWEQQIPALLKGETDLIMSGMSVTEARKVRVAFTDPYLKTGQMALMRRQDTERFHSPAALLSEVSTVGVKGGTTGDQYVQESMPNARKLTYMLPRDGAFDVKRKKIDIFIHDGPSIAWLVSENEAELTGLFTRLTEEDLAWAVRRGDRALQEAANSVLAGWRTDGTLERVLSYWMPYRDKMK